MPDLGSYDQIVVRISAGMDSQVAPHRTVLAADATVVLDRVVRVFCDLGAG